MLILQKKRFERALLSVSHLKFANLILELMNKIIADKYIWKWWHSIFSVDSTLWYQHTLRIPLRSGTIMEALAEAGRSGSARMFRPSANNGKRAKLPLTFIMRRDKGTDHLKLVGGNFFWPLVLRQHCRVHIVWTSLSHYICLVKFQIIITFLKNNSSKAWDINHLNKGFFWADGWFYAL